MKKELELSIFDERLLEKDKKRKKYEMNKQRVSYIDEDEEWARKKKKKHSNKKYYSE